MFISMIVSSFAPILFSIVQIELSIPDADCSPARILSIGATKTLISMDNVEDALHVHCKCRCFFSIFVLPLHVTWKEIHKWKIKTFILAAVFADIYCCFPSRNSRMTAISFKNKNFQESTDGFDLSPFLSQWSPILKKIVIFSVWDLTCLLLSSTTQNYQYGFVRKNYKKFDNNFWCAVFILSIPEVLGK